MKIKLKKMFRSLIIISLWLLLFLNLKIMAAETSKAAEEYAPGELIIKLKEGGNLAEIEELNQKYGVISVEKVFKGAPKPEDVLKELKDKLAKLGSEHQSWYWQLDKDSKEYKDYIAKIEKEEYELKSQIQAQEKIIFDLEETHKRAQKEGIKPPRLEDIYILKTQDKQIDVPAMASEYNINNLIEYAEPNYILNLQPCGGPADCYFLSKNSFGQTYDDLWGLKRIEADKVWDKTEGNGVIVAVLDTGVDYNHEDIKNNIWMNLKDVPNGLDDDKNGYIDDMLGWNFVDNNNDIMDKNNGDILDGHGTFIAGIIAAEKNDKGIVGVAPKVKIMAIKMLRSTLRGTGLVQAIEYAVNNGAKVLNNSWKTYATSITGIPKLLEDAINFADFSGCTILFAAGNQNSDISLCDFSTYANAIMVGGSNYHNFKTFDSNWGAKIDIVAPGESIISLAASVLDPKTNDYVNYEGYSIDSGTSFSCPFASGVAALLLSRNPNLRNKDIKTILRASATDIGTKSFDLKTGCGLLNARKALEIMNSTINAEITTPVNLEKIKDSKISIIGTAAGSDFKEYQLFYASKNDKGNLTRWKSITQPIFKPVSNGLLAEWNISKDIDMLKDYNYLLRLSVIDTKGSVFHSIIELTNYFDKTYETTPILDDSSAIIGQAGGEKPKFQLYEIGNMACRIGEHLISYVDAYPKNESGGYTYSVENLPFGALFNRYSGEFSWQPSSNQEGAYEVKFLITNKETQETVFEVSYINVDSSFKEKTTLEKPIEIYVTDDGEFTSSQNILHGYWNVVGSIVSLTSIVDSEYIITKDTPSLNAAIIKNWTNNGPFTLITATDLMLESGVTYYIGVRVKDKNEQWSQVSWSDGIKVSNFFFKTPVIRVLNSPQNSGTDYYIYARKAISSVSEMDVGFSFIDSAVGYEYQVIAADNNAPITPWTLVPAIKNWNDIAGYGCVTITGLKMESLKKYYVKIRAKDAKGNYSKEGSSDPVTVVTSLPDFTVTIDSLPEQSACLDWHITIDSLYRDFLQRQPEDMIKDKDIGACCIVEGIPPDKPITSFESILGKKIINNKKIGSTGIYWSNTSIPYSLSNLNLETEKTYYVVFKLFTEGGAWRIAYSKGITIKKDSTPPLTPIVKDNMDYTEELSFIKVTVSSLLDPESGIKTSKNTVQYKITESSPNGKVICDWAEPYGILELRDCTQSYPISGEQPPLILDLYKKNGWPCQHNQTYYIGVKVQNKAGLWSETGYSDGFKVDKTPPSAPIVTISKIIYKEGTAEVYVNFNSQDPESGIKGYAVGYVTEEYQTRDSYSTGSQFAYGKKLITTNSTIFTIPLTPYNLSKAIYIGVAARNNKDDSWRLVWSKPSYAAGIKLTPDTTPPGKPIIINAGDKISWSSEDKESDIAEYQYCIGLSSGAKDISDWKSTGKASIEIKDLNLTLGKTYYVTVKAKNAMGLWSEINSQNIVVDSTPPTTPIITYNTNVEYVRRVPPPLPGSGASFTGWAGKGNFPIIEWSSADPETGIDYYQYCIGSAERNSDILNWTKVDNTRTQVMATVSGGGPLEHNKTYYFTVKAVNKAGLESISCKKILVDSKNPEIVNKTVSPQYAQKLLFQVEAKDDFLGIESVKLLRFEKEGYRISSEEEMAFNPATGFYELSISPSSDLTSIRYGFRALDKINNSAEISIFDLTIITKTNQAPKLNLIGNQVIDEMKLLQFNLSATDVDGDVLSYSVSNSPQGANFSGNIFNWAPNYTQAGNYQVTFKVSDNKGGEASETITITVNNVNQKPIARIFSPFSSININQLITFDGSKSSDPDGNIVSYSWNFGDGNIASGKAATYKYAKTGNYTVSLTVTDNQGATGVSGLIITVKEPLPNAPSNLNAKVISFRQIKLTWQDNSNNELGFKIERSQKIDRVWLGWQKVDIVSSNITYYLDKINPMIANYRYRISAGNSSGYSNYSPVIEVSTSR